MTALPSMADRDGNPEWIAADLLAQAEHDALGARLELFVDDTLLATLGSRTVFTDASTRFRDSCTALANGTAVRVDGEEAASGQVYATTVDAR